MLNLLFFFNSEFFGVLMILNWLRFCLYCEDEYFSVTKMSLINFWMGLLVYLLYLMMLSVEASMKFSLNMLLFVLLYLMQTNSLVVFFLFYESVFILIMFVILLLGYSYERLLASFLMMFYSFVFSSPVLLMILLFDHVFLMKAWLKYSLLILYFFMASMMVKFPIFGFHYWLPVAHVEASTIGSMLLAGVLLKMGSVGLFYLINYMGFMVKFHWLSLGVIMSMMMIVALSDLKMMIAYSSVAHMSLVYYVMMSGYIIGNKGGIIMMFYHGFLSPLMFWLVGSLGWWKTRSLMVVKSMSFSYIFIFIVFIICIMNMGFPPFMGFLSEILMLKSLVGNNVILGVVVFSVLLSCYYNIYLLWCFSSGQGWSFKVNLMYLDVYLFLIWVMFLVFF